MPHWKTNSHKKVLVSRQVSNLRVRQEGGDDVGLKGRETLECGGYEGMTGDREGETNRRTGIWSGMSTDKHINV